MAGIASYGAYIPFYRLSRSEIGKAWGSGGGPGERAVANYDEDSLTMAVAAARDCIKGFDRATIGGVYFASTTAPYREKQSAALIAAVLGLAPQTTTMDLGGSLRCGTNALRAALDAVKSGSVGSVLVCAADTRLGYPAGPAELNFGDGAAALLVSAGDTVAEVTRFESMYHEIQDVWRSDKDTFVRSAEERFSMDEGYVRVMTKALSGAMKKNGLTPADLASVAINAPNGRQLKAMAKKLGVDDKCQAAEALHAGVGDTGCAQSLMALVGALEQAVPGQKILLGSYGNGCDTAILETTDRIASLERRRGIAGHLVSKTAMRNYNHYLRLRELLPTQPPARPALEIRQPSPAAQWREVPWELRLTGTKCTRCGTPQYPPQRVCVQCQTKDEMEPYNFVDVPAKVFSFSHDHVMETVDPPVTVTFVDFEGGGRLMCDMTDRDPAAVTVGMPVEFTFRRLYYVGGIYNYWWKCQPPRVVDPPRVVNPPRNATSGAEV
jgi:hydroxymethylglutaryl-CoA synthase